MRQDHENNQCVGRPWGARGGWVSRPTQICVSKARENDTNPCKPCQATGVVGKDLLPSDERRYMARQAVPGDRRSEVGVGQQ